MAQTKAERRPRPEGGRDAAAERGPVERDEAKKAAGEASRRWTAAKATQGRGAGGKAGAAS